MRSIPIPPSNLNTPTTTTTNNTLAPTTTVVVVTTTPSSPTSYVRSRWNSPVPYLFGGLATVMALVAFALLMLACSYWSLARTQHSENNNNNNVVKEGDDDPRNKEHPKVYEEEILVIMAGDHKPTFLATPSCPNNYSSSFAHGACNHFDKHLEDCDRSQKEITDNHVVVTDAIQESGSSQHEQRSR